MLGGVGTGLRVAEYLVRVDDLGKGSLRISRALVLVRVEAQAELAVGLPDLALGGLRLHAQHGIWLLLPALAGGRLEGCCGCGLDALEQVGGAVGAFERAPAEL